MESALISSFCEIVGETDSTARKYLVATNWNLNEAIPLYYASNDSNDVRAPIPVTRDTLYDNTTLGSSQAFQTYANARNHTLFWESDQDSDRDNLSSLYCPPYHLMFNGPFEKAKDAAFDEDRWLLVNLQSTTEFSSHMLNRDTWGNEAVSQTISNYFTFWQVYDDTTECMKVCNYYKLNSTPVVLVIDPITGQKMRSWSGMVQPEDLLHDLVQFIDSSPKNQLTASSQRPRTRTSENRKSFADISNTVDKEETCPPPKSEYPALSQEPEDDKNLVCKVGIRLPDGRRLRRNFFRADPIQLLWSFCSSQLKGAETKQFRLTQAVPGAVKTLDYESGLTFEESGLANSMVSVIWD